MIKNNLSSIFLKHRKTGKLVRAQILKANKRDMPLDWSFDWKKSYVRNTVFKIVVERSPHIIEGLVKILFKHDNKMPYMELIEVATHNYGSKNCEYEWVAGCLIAYGCKIAIQKGKNGYKGYLVFESKTKLIKHYIKTYDATHITANTMCFEPDVCKKHVKEFLGG